MVAMNADPSSLPELLGQPGPEAPETRDHLQLVPTPAELAVLDVSPSVEEMARGEFSQDVYARAVRRCFDEESLPYEERDHEKVRGLVKAKSDWLGMVGVAVGYSSRDRAIFSAYSFLLEAPHAKEQKAA